MVSSVWEYFEKLVNGKSMKCKTCGKDDFNNSLPATARNHLKVF